MLIRDRYAEDTVMQFFPDFSIINYVSHLAGLKPHYQYIMSKQQQKSWKNKLTSYLPASIFLVALIPIIFHKRIPKLKNFTSIKARVIFGLIYMVFPVAAGAFISANSEAQIGRKYQLNFEQFKKYRLTGDPTFMNSKIEFYEDL